MPKVTAIITTFNRAKLLPQAIESVIFQDMADWELIILNNSSSDNTEYVVSKYLDSRIRYFRHEAMGISRQRNLGVGLAQSEYIAFLDDDDIWLPTKLSKEYNFLSTSSPSVALVYGGFRFYDDTGKRWGEHKPSLSGKILLDLLWTQNPFTGSASNPMLRKSLIIKAGGYDERILAGEDWELYLRLADAYQIGYVPEILLEIRQHSGFRLGQLVDAALNTDKRVYLRYRHQMSDALKARYLQKIGGKLMRLRQKARAQRCLNIAIKLQPLNLLTIIQWLAVRSWYGLYVKAHTFYRNHLKRY